MRNKNEGHSKSEKVIYTALGGGLILTFVPAYIPYVVCFSGLLISLYGTMDTIANSVGRNKFNIKEYIENGNK